MTEAAAQRGDGVTIANLEKLFNISQIDDPRRFWEAMVVFFQDVAPHSIAVVSLSFSTLVFHDDMSSENCAAGRCLRIQQVYHDLQSEVPKGFISSGLTQDFPVGVASIGLETLRKTQAYYHPLVEKHGCNHLTALSTLLRHENNSNLYDVASFALYHGVETAQEAEINLKRYREYLDAIVRAFYARIVKLETLAGLNAFVVDLPIGIFLIGPDDRPVCVNAEAYRQAYLWNVAPAKKIPSDYKARFKLPHQIAQSINELGLSWRYWVVGTTINFETEKHLINELSPELRATVKMVTNRSDPFAKPDFLVRFSIINPHDQPNAVEIGDLKVSVLAELTNAERKVALHVVKGFSNNEIARLLGRQPSTIKEHLTHIYEKLKVRNRAQLIGRLIERYGTNDLGIDKSAGLFGFVTARLGPELSHTTSRGTDAL